MTALHQAAQKAVERIRHTLMTGLAHNDAIAALSEIVAMLPQHPDPETRPSMSMFASAADYNAAMDEWLTPPALQHQEVPREPVAFHTGEALRRAGIVCGRCGCPDLMYEGLAASPSTTRQQEVGSDALALLRDIVTLSSGPGFHAAWSRAKELVASAPSTPEKAQPRLVEGPPRDFGQAQDRYGEHMDRPAPGVGGNDGR